VSGRRIGIAAAAVAATLAIAGAALVGRALSPAATTAEPLIFTVAPGQPLASVARELERQGLVRSAPAVRALARWRGLASSLKAGEYRLSAAQTPGEILTHIAEGRVVTYEVVLPEGFTAAQVAERLAAEGLADRDAFLALVNDPESAARLGVEGSSLEGYLFPETYRLPKGLPVTEIARALVGQFRSVWEGLAPLASERGLSMRQVVTLASIVEKETSVDDERPLVASVFLNRLARGMRLETDPAVIYGIPNFDGNLRRRDLENAANPYNTYRIAGLPPGPIANPGADSLRAVVQPARSNYLYFVSRNDGTHVFSARYRDHLGAVNRYQKTHSP
jgi:UPF0755 protein